MPADARTAQAWTLSTSANVLADLFHQCRVKKPSNAVQWSCNRGFTRTRLAPVLSAIRRRAERTASLSRSTKSSHTIKVITMSEETALPVFHSVNDVAKSLQISTEAARRLLDSQPDGIVVRLGHSEKRHKRRYYTLRISEANFNLLVKQKSERPEVSQ